MRTLLIDNYDSFTGNLFHLVAEVTGQPPVIIRNNDSEAWGCIEPASFDAIVISPGPGSPHNERDFGFSRNAIVDLDLPVLGVCLGHQGLCHLAGAAIRHAPEPVHGRTSEVCHDGTGLFAGIPSPFQVVRYHSLLAYDLPPTLERTAVTRDGLIMAVKHRERPHWGVQFHPESILTEHGQLLMSNFRDLVAEWNHAHGRGGRPAGQALGQAASSLRSGGVVQGTPDRQPAGYQLHVRELVAAPDADGAFEALFAGCPGAFWLDSSRVIPGLSRYTFLGAAAGPLGEIVTYDVGTRRVMLQAADGRTETHAESIFDYLQRELAARQVSAAGELPFEFNLGYVGYLGYELKADCGADRPHTSEQPDAALAFCDRMLAIDHEEAKAWLLALSTPDSRAEAQGWIADSAPALERVRRAQSPADTRPAGAGPSCTGVGVEPQVRFRHDLDDYRRLIKDCQREISDGESYEICLTNELTVEQEFDPLHTYRVLRRISPAPYAALLTFPGFAVLSSSPERFLAISADRVAESKPIKGTRRRGVTQEEDLELIRDLSESVKDRAENLMIVDLVRNDLGTVAEVGSVHVPKIFGIESYATVHQMVSTVRARLAEGQSPVMCVRAAFPGGSMTGAPKLRTMELIDKFEGGARGVYSGALGYFALSGAVDLSIIIRTIVATPEKATMGVGGAITALSDPEDEVNETLVKADALIRALRESAPQRP